METKFLNSMLRSRSQLFLIVTTYLFFKIKCQINEMTLEIRYFLSSLFYGSNERLITNYSKTLFVVIFP
ncbi:hypothetical protein ST398NM02_2903 [Staphylococcus aureus subsp. aureus DR10]|uniref:Uncharacterized protein n=1 Tax=Staphylococcus aureus subsp. aureus DR10 TaxID=1155079 RepID=A0ABC9PXG2_STAA5|nr:hypothetical protein ST398NM01_2903 [Staphylococcus aureus subsp. aureus 71193]AFR73863.1 Hypothetical Protein C248_1881 [Staphylococcus aureus 08BA02176]EIA13128.1 hypothetical protein ST398NM02_2903 [Staphylococcus aureus subsp. aureus DR10]MBG1004940.1 hypothetical protein [Staphylococcus aureus]MBG1133586.1 hypothetical protein [Staphylococcus aureus]